MHKCKCGHCTFNDYNGNDVLQRARAAQAEISFAVSPHDCSIIEPLQLKTLPAFIMHNYRAVYKTLIKGFCQFAAVLGKATGTDG